jgi:hypothetical protein
MGQDSWAVRRLFFVLVMSLAAASCLFDRPRIKHPELPRDVTSLTLVGQFSIPSLGRFPPVMGLPFGGISGLTTRDAGREIYGISDARGGGRIYRFALENPGGALRVETLSTVSLEMAPGEESPDHEGIVLLHDGTFAVSAEGTGRAPRQPASVAIYGRHGDFVHRLPIPEKFVPEPNGSATKGARGNAGFESLALSPDGERLFTTAETALLQDGEAATFEAGARTRILEFVAGHGTFEPAREFAYDLEPVPKPTFTPNSFINGLVELLALDRTTLLALERAFVENQETPELGRSYIRLYRITLTDATDISALESLKGHPEVVPVKKTLLMDLSKVQGLSPDLARNLDNFEGIAIGPRLPDGRATLLLVSDDNFRAEQRTWFLLFAIE